MADKVGGNSTPAIRLAETDERKKDPAFEIKARVVIELDVNLALELGDFLIDSRPTNKAIWALGCRLSEIVPPKK